MANLTLTLHNHERLLLLKYVNADLKLITNGKGSPTVERLTKLYALQNKLTRK